jgi:hypothetical protein
MFRFDLSVVPLLLLALRCEASTVALSGSIIRKVSSPSVSHNQNPLLTTFQAGRRRRCRSFPTTVIDDEDDPLLDMDDYMKVEECSVSAIRGGVLLAFSD